MRDARGRFLSGHDPDRHRLTRGERRLGYFVAITGGRKRSLPPSTITWVRRKVQQFYRHKRTG